MRERAGLKVNVPFQLNSHKTANQPLTGRRQGRATIGSMDLSDYMTTEQAAEALNTTPMAVRKMIDREQIKGEKIGMMWFIPKAEVEKARNRRKRGRPKKIAP